MTIQSVSIPRWSLLLALLTSAVSAADPVRWSEPTDLGGGTGVIGSGDFNADGQVDIAYRKGSEFVWSPGPDFDTAHTIGSFAHTAYGGTCADINGDGWPDFVGAYDDNSNPGTLSVYLHPGNAADATQPWQKIDIYTLDIFHQNDMVVHDVDGDGRLDVVIKSRTVGKRIVVALQNEDLTDWTVRMWDTAEWSFGEGLACGDVDNDGQTEIVYSGKYLDNPDGWRTGEPTAYLIDADFEEQPVKVRVFDADGDGDSDDVVISKAERAETLSISLYIHDGTPSAGPSAWTKTVLKANVTNYHGLEVGDFDNDGDTDILAAQAFSEQSVRIFYNSGDGTAWTEYTVSTTHGFYVLSVVDLDGDGDLDLIGPRVWQGKIIRFLNRFIEDGGAPTEPPPAPDGVAAQTLSASAIRVTWNDVDTESGYRVERGTPTPFSTVATLGANTTSYEDTGLEASTAYFYRVIATNTAGESAPSAGVSATTSAPDLEPPTAPANLSASAASSSRVTLAWNPATDNVGVGEYQVFRNGSLVGSVSTPGFEDTGLEPSVTYTYRVRALDTAGNASPLSVEAAATTPAAPDFSEFLAAYWKLDAAEGDTAVDEQGAANGTLLNGPVWRPDGGKRGGALEFDGSDDRVSLGTLDLPAGDGLTITCWVRFDSFVQDEARFVSKASGTSDQNHYWMLGNFVDGTALRFRLKTDNGGTTTLVSDTGLLAAGVWHHVAAVYDGSEMRIVLDGVQVASTPKSGAVAADSAVAAALGNQPAGAGDRALDGRLDEVRLYNTALTIEQIQRVMALPDRYAEWGATHFSGAELADPDHAGKSADPDHDGAPNFIEFAYGGDPEVADAEGLLPRGGVRREPAVDGPDRVLFTIRYRKNQPDALRYFLEATDSLTTPAWTEVTSMEAFDAETGEHSRTYEVPASEREKYLRLQLGE